MTAILENTADVPPNPTTPRTPSDVKGLSQGRIVLKRFFGHTRRHRRASSSCSSCSIARHLGHRPRARSPAGGSTATSRRRPLVDGGRPTLQLFPFSLGEHPFGQDSVGRDMFAMVMRGTQISMFIMVDDRRDRCAASAS